jgi:hypothetical protein
VWTSARAPAAASDLFDSTGLLIGANEMADSFRPIALPAANWTPELPPLDRVVAHRVFLI